MSARFIYLMPRQFVRAFNLRAVKVILPISSVSQGRRFAATKESDAGVRVGQNVKAVVAKTVSLPPHQIKLRTTNKLITPLRACREYCLNPADLKPLPRQHRRSAYLGEPPEIMYLLSDIEGMAVKKFGSVEAAKRRAQMVNRGASQGYSFTQPLFASIERRYPPTSMFRSSTGRVVMLAVGLNGTLAVAKGFAWWFTSSHSMFAEMLHSGADTCNQIVLALGVRESKRAPDKLHPYGYSNFGHVTSLISGVGILFVGTGLTWYDAIHALNSSFDPYSLQWCLGVLGGSLICESATLLYALYVLRRKAARDKQTLFSYIRRTDDPSLNVVLVEDTAAVIGIVTAATCISLSHWTMSVVPDAVGSFLIGCLLAGSAYFIVRENTSHLMGRSIPAKERETLIKDLESDVMVRAVKDVKATELGDEKQRLKAELDFEGRNITRAYLGTQDLNAMMSEMKKFERTEQVESFMIRHGEGIVDRLGTEVDRIEDKLKKKHPELRHIDLEAL